MSTLKQLAQAIASQPTGSYAIMKSYYASKDGSYTQSPINTAFAGRFEGLGNSIRNLSISTNAQQDTVGLFSELQTGGAVRDLTLMNNSVQAVEGQNVGLLAGITNGAEIGHVSVNGSVAGGSQVGGMIGWSAQDIIVDASSSGSVSGNDGIGGLIGVTDTTVLTRSSSTAAVNSPAGDAGGLVGDAIGQQGYMDNCFASGPVTTGGSDAGGLVADAVVPVSSSFALGNVTAGDDSVVGGLAAYGLRLIKNSYAVGTVSAGANSEIGGLVGSASGEYTSYSLGPVSAGTGSYIGGLIGYDSNSSDNRHLYWDLDTSNVNNPAQGAGNIPNDPGVKGTSDAQLKAELPKGFNPKIWGQNPSINNGYPYLLANPPPR